MTHPLWTFHGGLHLDGHKDISTSRPVQTLPAPAHVTLPVQQHIGSKPEVIVEVGDKVGKGQVLARATDYVSAPLHATTSGTISAIEERPVPHPSGLPALCIVIEADGEDRWADGLPAQHGDYQAMDEVSLRNIIREAGIVGLGGAAFPTAVKLNPSGHDINTLVINGAECEPFITCDDMLMREHASEVISGIRVIQSLIKPVRTLIGIEDNKPEAIAAMREAMHEQGMEGSDVVPVPTLYPTGGEKQLIRVLTGREVPSGGLPLDINVICQNVGTAFAIHKAVVDGEPLISRLVTVTGDAVKAPQNMWARIGTHLSELVAAAGGYEDHVERLILGGPMMGFAMNSDELPAIKSSNCILVASEKLAPPPPTPMPCIRCGACVDVCPANLLPQQLHWYAHARDFDKVQDYHLFDCIECGCCAQVCPSQIPLVQYYRFAKTEIWKQEREKARSDHARQRHDFRQERLERAAREKAERLAKKKAALKKPAKSGNTDDPKKAAIQAALDRVKAKKAAEAASSTQDSQQGDTP